MALNLATINIRGLGSLSKKKYLGDFMDDNCIDIACIQEVSNPFHDFPSTKYKYILNHGSSALGRAFVIKNNINPNDIKKDPPGQITKLIF